MKIFIAGLNHNSAPVSIREKLAFDQGQMRNALALLKDRYSNAEFAIISTCNRVELYCATDKADELSPADIIKFIAQFHRTDYKTIEKHMYVHLDEDAARHLMMVASSLDSMVVGEEQIQNQVKQGYTTACTAGTTGKILNRLFHAAFSASKSIRNNTAIFSGRVSVAGVAVQLARQLFADIRSAKIVVVGAGEVGELLVQHLLHSKCEDITIVNRSYERGVAMAKKYNAAASKWSDLDAELSEANIVIGSASCQGYLFTKDQLEKIMKNRRDNALLVIDIAVPRNFEPTVNGIENIYLYSIDELSAVADDNRKARETDLTSAMQIVYDAAAEFMSWFRGRDIGVLIGLMKENFGKISGDELDRFFVGKRKDADCRAVAETMVNRIVSRLSHCVIENVDEVARIHGNAEAAKMLDGIIQQAQQIAEGQKHQEADPDEN